MKTLYTLRKKIATRNIKRLLRSVCMAFVALIATVSLTSCDNGDTWWGAPPYGWDTFNDTRLGGYWQLVQYNSDPVAVGSANYMYFNGNGYGIYYYRDNGYRESERIRYWSQDAVYGASNYQINIQYEFSSPLTCSYWFTHGNNTLWMQWQTGGGRVQTYVYDRVPGAPW